MEQAVIIMAFSYFGIVTGIGTAYIGGKLLYWPRYGDTAKNLILTVGYPLLLAAVSVMFFLIGAAKYFVAAA